MTPTSSSQELRAELMAAEAFTRVKALYALECAADLAPTPALARELNDFVARGVPYFCADDEHYLAWVDKAVAFWDRVHRPAATVRRLTTARAAAGTAHAQHAA